MSPRTAQQHLLLPYGIAVLAVGVVLGLKAVLASRSIVEGPFLLFLGAVLFSAWSGGVGPGLLATVLSSLAIDYFFLPPIYDVLADDFSKDVRLAQFLAEGTFISVLSGLRRRSSREAHRRAEELSVTLQCIGDAILATDADGRVTLLNPRAEELTGWRSREAAGRPVGDILCLLDEATRERVPTGPIIRAPRGERRTGAASRRLLVASNGSEWPVDECAAPIRGQDGRPIGAVIVFRDVSERRQAESARAETIRRTAAILESISDAFYALDRAWRFTYLNAHALSYLGRPSEEVLERVVWEVFPQTVGSVFETEFRQAMSTGRTARFEAESTFRGRWVEVAAYPSLEGLAVYFRDVTDRKQAEQEQARLQNELAAEQSLLRAVLDQMPAGVVVADKRTGRVVVANARAGLPWEGASGDGSEKKDLNADEPLGLILARAMGGESIHAEEVRRFACDRRMVWLRVNAVPIRAAGGAVKAAVVVLDDITTEKKAEAVLRQSHAELQGAVTKKDLELARTADHLETEVTRRRVAERARQQLIARLTTISEDERRRLSRELHDETSQLLAAIIVGLKKVRERLGPEWSLASAFEALQRQAEQISRSVHRIAWELRPAALDAMGLEAAVRSFAERWSEWTDTPVEFHANLGTDRLPLEVETQLYRIITEALSNVLKHARATRIIVSLDHYDGTIVAFVEDNGRGFDPDSTDGNGRLGLLGMRERALLLGGTLHVESAPGHGTTVLFRGQHPAYEERP